MRHERVAAGLRGEIIGVRISGASAPSSTERAGSGSAGLERHPRLQVVVARSGEPGSLDLDMREVVRLPGRLVDRRRVGEK